jgi:hypothetical protein
MTTGIQLPVPNAREETMYLNCYSCGQPGHQRANCPQRGGSREHDPSPRPPADAGPDNEETSQATATRYGEKSRDYDGWANYARSLMQHAIASPCPSPDPKSCAYDSQFRQQQRSGPVHEHDLRDLAARQVAEARAERLVT